MNLLLLESLTESKEAIGTHLGAKMLAATIVGSSSYHQDTGGGKSHFGIHPLAY